MASPGHPASWVKERQRLQLHSGSLCWERFHPRLPQEVALQSGASVRSLAK
jgi:hypothetical protein